jgi:hypothetical protein
VKAVRRSIDVAVLDVDPRAGHGPTKPQECSGFLRVAQNGDIAQQDRADDPCGLNDDRSAVANFDDAGHCRERAHCMER